MKLATLSVILLGCTAVASAPVANSLYDFTMPDIDGKSVKLEKFKGKVVVVVNVASQCGNTPQYEGLEKLYREHKKDGLVVLGFPANEFGGQEPGSNEEIKKFCTGKYDVTFPMFSKIVVKGQGIHPLYQWLTSKTNNVEIDWNFAKFVVGRDGQVIKRFSARTKPDSQEFLASVKSALEAKD